ncbi:polyprenyl synthetase family protein [Nocardia beijingensis]|uniref:polyprenyl synthetase family protein n=1 Tax=Nocardia beijingensis TaxID=95162 RepID=UPI0018956779|nr:polyprenyl synthetase family protein [Nocardia beijingensis]MBF6470092.1 polyprenyl synthetase family protein [Nocardia beijingensis]
MTAVDNDTQVMDVVRGDSELLEADLRVFLAELTVSAAQVAGSANGPQELDTAVRQAFHNPVTDALGSKVGQEALRPAGGPGFRPSIVYWVFRNYRGFANIGKAGADLHVIRRVAVAVRILLKAAVVLDDIEDGSAVRYGEPALHTTHGVPLALNTGAWMVLAALRHAESPAVVNYLVRAVENGFIGQALDMSTRLAEIRRDIVAADGDNRVKFWESVATLKTSTLFRMPLNAAATALRVPDDELTVLDDAMRQLGFASQIFNDLTDFVPEFGGANTYEDFDGLTNRVCLELLGLESTPSEADTDLVGDRLKMFALGHPRLGNTLVELAGHAVDLKEEAKRRIHQLCRSAGSATYFDLTIDRKGHVMERLFDAVRTQYPNA